MLLCNIVVLTLILLATQRYGCCPTDHHCQDDICHDVTGYCLHGCEPDWNGSKCNTKNVCPTCKWGYCDENRICISGCKPGYYGDTCNKTCSNQCSGKCELTSGICLGGCEKGWYGPYCSKHCGSGCAEQCHRWHGTCSCTIGWYGQGCCEKCNGCVDNLCDSVHGQCNRGCKLGWTGTTCSTNACRACRNSTCVVSGNDLICPNGCRSGYWGSKCDHRCFDECDLCNQNDGRCLEHITEEQTYNNIWITSSGQNVSQNTRTNGNNVTIQNTTTILTAIWADETAINHTVGRRPISYGGLNAKTRWYIFTWVSLLVIFLVAMVIWCSYKEWRKHKLETRDLDKWLELTSPIYLPVEQLGHAENTQNADSALYMELDRVSGSDSRNKTQTEVEVFIDLGPYSQSELSV